MNVFHLRFSLVASVKVSWELLMQTCWWPLSDHWSVQSTSPHLSGFVFYGCLESLTELSALWGQCNHHGDTRGWGGGGWVVGGCGWWVVVKNVSAMMEAYSTVSLRSSLVIFPRPVNQGFLYPCLSQRQGKGGLITFLSSHCWTQLAELTTSVTVASILGMHK